MKLHVEYEGRVCDYEIRPMVIYGALLLAALKICGIPALITAGILVFFYGVYRVAESM